MIAVDLTGARDLVDELLAEYGIPSAVVGVLQDGNAAEFAAGVTNVSTRQPAETGTIYQCGSMTKTWTALAFMQFVDEGTVRLDETVRAYLPGFRVADPEVTATVTPRHLLYHTSGIEEDFGDPGEEDDVYERMVENIADAPQVHPLGYTHGYSAALGYAILARIMEVLDGKRWDAIIATRLFARLGLTGTTSLRAQVDRDKTATGHVIRSLDEGPIRTPVDYLPRSFGPGGNISSTIQDVLTTNPRLPRRRQRTERHPDRFCREHPRDDALPRPHPRPVHVRPGMGSRPHRVQLARRNRVCQRRQHNRPERPPADPP